MCSGQDSCLPELGNAGPPLLVRKIQARPEPRLDRHALVALLVCRRPRVHAREPIEKIASAHVGEIQLGVALLDAQGVEFR